MNKQIEKFIDDAGLVAVAEMFESELQKFAELIVRECAGIVTDAVYHREPASTYADRIQQHFGLKECGK